MILVWIEHILGDCAIAGYKDYKFFVADSFSFGVEREMKESGEKGGTEDLNIGIGELQECTISKSMDSASPYLAQAAINGNSLGTALIDFVEIGGAGGESAVKGEPLCYLRYRLDRCFVKSWTTSGDADDRPTEEIAFYYNRIAFGYCGTKDGRVFDQKGVMRWDNVASTPWEEHGIQKGKNAYHPEQLDSIAKKQSKSNLVT